MPVVELVPLSATTIAALAAGDLDAANATSPVPLTDWQIGPEARGTWRYRAEQLAARPDEAGWITRAIWDPARGITVGQAGFHGPPDERGMVEVGYGVDPLHRRRGYARAAFEVLLRRAQDEPTVHVLRATISPGNIASERLVADYGLVRTGEQWDDEDGLETIYELAV